MIRDLVSFILLVVCCSRIMVSILTPSFRTPKRYHWRVNLRRWDMFWWSFWTRVDVLSSEIYIKLTWYKTNFTQKIKKNLIPHGLTPLNSNFNVKEHQTWMQTLPINAFQHTVNTAFIQTTAIMWIICSTNLTGLSFTCSWKNSR